VALEIARRGSIMARAIIVAVVLLVGALAVACEEEDNGDETDPTATVEATEEPTEAATEPPPPTATEPPLPTNTLPPPPTNTPVDGVGGGNGGGGDNCHPSYTGACLAQGIGDYDCSGGSGDGPNYTGRVNVVGPDEFGLDADSDGVGCE